MKNGGSERFAPMFLHKFCIKLGVRGGAISECTVYSTVPPSWISPGGADSLVTRVYFRSTSAVET